MFGFFSLNNRAAQRMKDERGCGGRTERVAVGRPTVANTRPLRAPLNPYCQE